MYTSLGKLLHCKHEAVEIELLLIFLLCKGQVETHMFGTVRPVSLLILWSGRLAYQNMK